MSDNQLAERPAASVKEYLALPAYRDRFHEVLGKRAPQFMAAITSLANTPGLQGAEPRSVIGAAMVAATLDLPVNPTLGMAHVVAYGDGQGNKVAQFQLGYKGIIQLAMRSGQYKRLNAGPVNAEVFKGYDIVGEPTLDWNDFDPAKPTAGYFCAFETLNGFTKVVYWTRAQVEAHAKRFSKAYQKGYKSSPWFSDFDSMATKTVIKAALTKWGIMSVEMQKVATHDQATVKDIDAEPEYIDNASEAVSVGEEGAPPRPPPPPRKKRGANIVEAEEVPTPEPKRDAPAEPKPVEAAPEETAESNAPEVAPEPVKEPVKEAANEPVQSFAEAANQTKVAEPSQRPARTSLQKDETLEVVVEVVEVACLMASVKNGEVIERKPTIRARVKGEYVGEVIDFNGAVVVTPEVRDESGTVTKAAGLKPKSLYAAGKQLRMRIWGRHNAKANRVDASVVTAAEIEQGEF